MNQRPTYYLAVLAVLFCYLAPAPACAQVLKGTFAAGSAHSLSIHADGTLWATGSNQFGELGDGTTTNRNAWAQVGTATNWLQVAAGEFTSYGLRTDGTLYVWGYNNYGQLSLPATSGTSLPTTVPTPVPGTWAQVIASPHHTLALRADGTLWAWGMNTFGQLGNPVGTGMTTANPTPAQIPGTWVQAATGEYHTLALSASGSVYAWGTNSYGQLSGLTSSGPVLVAGTYTQVAAGRYHSLALGATGNLWAWGRNPNGQLAIASTTPLSNVPLPVAGTYVQLAGGGNHCLALRADGNLLGWGQASSGQLGTGTIANVITPTSYTTALPTRSTAAGYLFGLAIRGDGTLWAWGSNQYGQLGDGTYASRLRPGQIGTDRDWVQVVAGASHAVALKANGQAYAWGRNNNGQASVGTSADLPTPTQLSGPAFTSLAAGAEYNLGLTATGTLYAWGANSVNQLGIGVIGASQPTPTAVSGSNTFVSMSAGAGHSLALTATGTLYAWGNNQLGQAGNIGSSGTTPPVGVPTLVAGAPQLRQVAAGSLYSLGLTATGVAYGWGNNLYGETGNTATSGTVGPHPTPAAIGGLPLLKQVAAGSAHSLGLTEAGTIYSWGSNDQGALAQGTTNSGPAPVPAQEATYSTSWAQLASGSVALAALVRTASAQTFASAGANSNGQLGDGTTTSWPRFDRLSPLTSLQPLPMLAAVGGAPAFSLYPNPAHGAVQALGLPAAARLAVYDALGRCVRPAAAALSVAGLPAGLYLVRATAPGQAPQTTRLVVE